MEAKKKLLTYAGLKALEDELENLKVVKRREIAQKINPQFYSVRGSIYDVV